MIAEEQDPWLDEFLGRAHRLMDLAITRSQWDENAAVRRHLREGFIRRLMMIETAFRYFDDLKLRQKPLNLGEVEHANIYVNALYLNLRGALDNLAWVIATALDVFPTLSEASTSRKMVDLFHRKFRSRLKEIDQELHDRLGPFEDWYNELRGLRDPAAHRIPLYIPPSVITEQSQVDRFREHEAKHAEAITAGDLDSAGAHLVQMGKVADFAPVIVMSTEESLRPIRLHAVIERDGREFFSLSEVVFGLLVAPRASGINSWLKPAMPRRHT